MTADKAFTPWPALFKGKALPGCRASVIVPARNEESSLALTLDVLAHQTDEQGSPLPANLFEIILLLNNCTDDSAKIARQWKNSHPHINLHLAERTLPPDVAHVGTARRMLMDTAWKRLKDNPHVCGILSTDSDTIVSHHWITRNLKALDAGADAVGGVICLKQGELETLPPGARQAYLLDREYQGLVARLEDLLDPQPGDPWPRHLEHFGASLACTPAAYAAVGGMPPVKPLEDVAFVNALRLGGCRLRHDPSVVVYTSSRFDGRAEIGLSFQLREWQRGHDEHIEHSVESASWLTHRFKTLAHLRQSYLSGQSSSLTNLPANLNTRLQRARSSSDSEARFLQAIDCDQIIESTYRGARHQQIQRVNRALKKAIATILNKA